MEPPSVKVNDLDRSSAPAGSRMQDRSAKIFRRTDQREAFSPDSCGRSRDETAGRPLNVINKFAGRCGKCGQRVAAGAGQALRIGGGWSSFHDACAPVQTAPPVRNHRGWHDMPVVGFDIEGTDPEPQDTRIVTAALVYADGTARTWLIDPGVPIPAGATAIHGITDEMVRDAGASPREALAELGIEIAKLIADSTPLVAFCAHYDVTALHTELARHGLPAVEWERAIIVDPSILHAEVEPRWTNRRQLGDLCGFYEVELATAHDAVSDAKAAAGMAVSIAARHERIALMRPDDLHRAQVTWYAEQKRDLQAYYDKQGRDVSVSLEWPLETKRRR
ncbi:exonuclease domain-containing protein [Micromonospora sp. NPDC047467]|uniref:exonuclease domain-containing protein n=1 Tax=Micromonospora sp. NPDC047467 TaxID=3154814 RepID=UPI0033C9EF1B